MCAEEGGSILIFDRDVVRCELILRPIASRLGAANEFGHASGKVLRAETTNTKACVVDLVIIALFLQPKQWSRISGNLVKFQNGT